MNLFLVFDDHSAVLICSQTFGFHPVAASCVPTLDKIFADRAEQPRMMFFYV